MGRIISLDRRLTALEAHRAGDLSHLSHLTDEELQTRMVSLCEQIGDQGVVLPEGWHERQDFQGVLACAREHLARLVA